MVKQKGPNDCHVLRPLTGDLVDLLSPAQLLTHYLSASYGYYIHHESVWETDQAYDYLCKRLLEVFDTFEHRHKHLTDKEALAAGTGYHIALSDYPPQVYHGWPNYVTRLNNGSMEYAIRRIHLIGEEAYLAELETNSSK